MEMWEEKSKEYLLLVDMQQHGDLDVYIVKAYTHEKRLENNYSTI